MGFDNVLFPLRISRDSRGGPEFSTDITEVASGFERRNQNWASARLRFNVASSVRTQADHEILLAFFYARAGRARGFRFRDWTDHRSGGHSEAIAASDQIIGTGDGAQQFFQLIKTYRNAGFSYTRKITRPVVDSVQIALAGVPVTTGVSIDHETGLILFDTPPSAGLVVSAGFIFDLPARFDFDQLEPVWIFEGAFQQQDLPIVELRE